MKIFEEFWRLASHDDEDDDFEEFEAPETNRIAERRVPSRERAVDREREREPELVPSTRSKRNVERKQNTVVDIPTNTNAKVVVMEPKKYSEEVKTIAEYLRDKHTIFLNLEQTDEDEACRILDFLAGVAYAVDGNVRKIATSTYVITPFTVTLMDSLMDGLEKEGIFYKEDKGIF